LENQTAGYGLTDKARYIESDDDLARQFISIAMLLNANVTDLINGDAEEINVQAAELTESMIESARLYLDMKGT
jgi:hypothetical protein